MPSARTIPPTKLATSKFWLFLTGTALDTDGSFDEIGCLFSVVDGAAAIVDPLVTGLVSTGTVEGTVWSSSTGDVSGLGDVGSRDDLVDTSSGSSLNTVLSAGDTVEVSFSELASGVSSGKMQISHLVCSLDTHQSFLMIQRLFLKTFYFTHNWNLLISTTSK